MHISHYYAWPLAIFTVGEDSYDTDKSPEDYSDKSLGWHFSHTIKIIKDFPAETIGQYTKQVDSRHQVRRLGRVK